MSITSKIPLSVPSISGNEWKYIKDCLDTGWVSSAGSYVTRFEKDISTYVGASHAVATVNGTAALHISLMLCGIGAGDEVIVPTLTFIAPVNALRYVNANPVFMDCDDHLNIDVEKIEDFCQNECEFKSGHLINMSTKAKVKAILLVHVFGHPVNMEAIMALAEKFHLKVIEDATESLGSFYKEGKYKGRHTGTIGDIGCYSFNGNKIITTGGGGMIVTHSKELADKARYYTTQAKDDPERFLHHEVGYNYRLTNIQAAMGCAQLERLDSYIRTKRKNFEIYREHLNGVEGLRLIIEPEHTCSNYWHYTLLVNERKFGINSSQLGQMLKDQGVETRPIWELNHRQRPHDKFQTYKIERACMHQKNGMNLPCSVDLETENIEKVCKIIRKK